MNDLVDLMNMRENMLRLGMQMRFNDDYEPDGDVEMYASRVMGVSQYSKIVAKSIEGAKKYIRSEETKH